MFLTFKVTLWIQNSCYSMLDKEYRIQYTETGYWILKTNTEY